jgi:hypothetical protein
MADRYDFTLDAGADFAMDVQWLCVATTLAAAYTVTDTTITVVNTQNAPSSGAIKLVTPAGYAFYLTYTGKTPTTFTGCSTSGAYSTTAVALAAPDGDALGAYVAGVQSLSGYSARLSLRRQYEDAAAALALTSGSGLTLTAGTGTVAVAITAAQAAALSGGYVYDLEVESSGGTITRLLQGRVIVSPQASY